MKGADDSTSLRFSYHVRLAGNATSELRGEPPEASWTANRREGQAVYCRTEPTNTILASEGHDPPVASLPDVGFDCDTPMIPCP